MKKYTCSLMLLLLPWLATFSSETEKFDKTPEEIISRHIEAHGGKENWNVVEALELKGRFTSFSEVHDFYTLKTAGGEFFSSFNLGKHRVHEGYDGTTFWTIDPWQGFDFPRKINKAERHVIMQKAEFFSPFYRWEERGLRVDFQGKEEVDGLEMYVLTLTRPDMSAETWFIDTQTYLVYKSITPWVDFAFPLEAEAYYDDYREVNGLLLPHYVEQTFRTRHRVTVIEEVIINPAFDSQVFRMPPCPHMEKITHMAGLWDVQVEMINRAGNWQVVDTVSSGFEKLPGEGLQGSISYEVNFPVTTSFTINYNRRTDNYQLVVYNEFYSTTELFNGSFLDGSLIFDNLPEPEQNETSAGANAQQPYMQFIFNFSDDKSFVVERKRSLNHGENWQDTERMTFHRKNREQDI